MNVSSYPSQPAPIGLDWSGRGKAPLATIGPLAPCRYCGRPALLREPGHPRTPLHKICGEKEMAALAAQFATRGDGATSQNGATR